MNNITVIGTGYVGLVSGTCFSEFGINVKCMDIDNNKIQDLRKGTLPIYEPGLEALVKKNVESGRLTFTTDFKEAVECSDVIFIAVGTPSHEDGSADLQYVLSAAREIAYSINGYKIIVNKSTVPVGTGRKVQKLIEEILEEREVDFKFDMVSNPEFLREGSAINDFTHPDRIIIGVESNKAEELMREVYRVLFLNNHPFVFTNIETAELIKYASNAFLATKITYINEIAALCEKIGADIKLVAKAMGLDKRIGKFFLNAGPGYGGSCFPKDTKALVHIGSRYDVEMNIVKAVISANDKQKLRMVDKILGKLIDVNDKTIAILGLAFKPETDDMRESSSIVIVNELLRRGAIIKVFDPICMENARRYYFKDNDIKYCKSEYDAITDSDALVLITEWNQFRSLDIDKIKKLMSGSHFFDFRNIYDRFVLESKGFDYEGVGR